MAGGVIRIVGGLQRSQRPSFAVVRGLLPAPVGLCRRFFRAVSVCEMAKSKVLLIAPSFFGYRDSVAAELRRQGEEVVVMNDRPSESTLFKSLGKVSYGLVDAAIDRYSCDIARIASRGDFARVIYMGGMSFCFSRKQMERIRSASSAFFVAYLWDSLANCQRFGESASYFDNVMSFDPGDCVRGVTLRPLFYRDALSSAGPKTEDEFEYDACFIGTVHQVSKFKTVLKVCDGLESEGLRVFKYFYIPGRTTALLRSFSDWAYWGNNLQFEPIDPGKLKYVYEHSRSIIDAPQKGQRGLTMRSIESVGLKRKLITANQDVLNYDFAGEGRVCAVGCRDEVPRQFFESTYRELPPDVYGSYSIVEFSKALMGRAPLYEGYRNASA